MPGSQSLFDVADGAGRLYLRYSRVHEQGTAFFGLRHADLLELDGHESFICLFTDGDSPPLFIPHSDFEQIIRQSPLATDGQYKVRLLSRNATHELFIPRVGWFNLDGYGGTAALASRLELRSDPAPPLSHCQVQTLLSAIGHANGYGVYVPPNNFEGLDWNLTERFHLVHELPQILNSQSPFTREVDVIWLDQSAGIANALFEVEHSTQVYSGLLRFNDLLLTTTASPRLFIVADEGRRDLFSRQLNRPTFLRSGLSDVTSFLDYSNVYTWHRRICSRPNLAGNQRA